jgi:hypothetical protein
LAIGRPRGSRFAGDNSALAPIAPRAAARPGAVAAKHPVARNRELERVSRAGIAHRARTPLGDPIRAAMSAKVVV